MSDCVKLILQHVSLGQNHIVYLEDKGIKIHDDCKPLLKRYNLFKDKLYKIHHCYSDDKEEKSKLLKELIEANEDNFSYATQIEFNQLSSIKTDDPKYYKDVDSHMYHNFLKDLNSEELTILSSSKNSSFNINQKNSNGNTILMDYLDNVWSSNEDQLNYYNLLVRLGADIKVVNSKGEFPLLLAVKKQKVALVKKLLNDGATFNFPEDQKLYDDVITNNLSSYGFLSSYNFNDSFKEIMKILVEQGFNLNQKSLMAIERRFMDFNPEIKTVTPWSVMRDYSIPYKVDMPLEFRIFFIEQGANPNQLSYQGKLELNTAINNGWEDYILLLLKNKANPNLVDEDGLSPLHAAAKKGDEKTMKLLKEFGAKSTPNQYGKMPEDILSNVLSSKLSSKIGLFKVEKSSSTELNKDENTTENSLN